MDSKKKVCHRSGKTIYPADKQINFGGFDFLATHFTCASTGTRLNLKTATKIDGEVYLRGEVGAYRASARCTNWPPRPDCAGFLSAACLCAWVHPSHIYTRAPPLPPNRSG